ncbi:hypothetical protein Hanom_Chr16g01465121 [Helianthus anomalus]
MNLPPWMRVAGMLTIPVTGCGGGGGAAMPEVCFSVERGCLFLFESVEKMLALMRYVLEITSRSGISVSWNTRSSNSDRKSCSSLFSVYFVNIPFHY